MPTPPVDPSMIRELPPLRLRPKRPLGEGPRRRVIAGGVITACTIAGQAMTGSLPGMSGALRALVAAALVAGLQVARADEGVGGTWDGPIGRVELRQDGQKLQGVLVEDSPVCPFRKGERVLDGMLLLGNVSGKVRLCVLECGAAGERWAFSMLVRGEEQMSGAAHVPGKGCKVPGRSEKGGVVFRRVTKEDGAASLPAGPAMPEGVYDPRRAQEPREVALAHARDGAQYLTEGRFELARARFQASIEADPTYAEGYNGVGVTYALRRDWEQAIEWYRKSIQANADLGDAYYNLACAYAQTDRAELSVRYLRLAVLNGYSEVSHLEEDPDLRPLKGRKDYADVLKLGRMD